MAETIMDLLTELDRIEDLPVLSAHLQRLQQVVRDERTTVDQIVQLVERDPTFATNLLKLANSVFYARPQKVASIKQAVQMIGFEGVANMSLTLEVIQSFGSSKELDIQAFWDHSVSVAFVAKELADANKVSGDTAYLVALLHDIGILILLQFMKERFRALMEACADGMSAQTAGAALFGCTPIDITVYMMKRWKFDEVICETLRKLMSVEREVSPEVSKLALAVHNAHKISEQHGGAFEWDVLQDLPADLELSSSREFGFAKGIAAAVLSCVATEKK